VTFLPIVNRELRVAARRGGTYRLRLVVPVAGMLIGVCALMVSTGMAPKQVGHAIFEGLSLLLLLYCLIYGRRATADCLSWEKREGTLGLLFLTDLKAYDIILGKLAATSLGGFYGLLSAFPVLAVPLLMGGTTNGEFWRTVLVLVCTFQFSLAVGIFGSSLSREYHRAMEANFILLLLLVAAGPVCGGVIALFSPSHPFIKTLLLPCPFYTLYLCSDMHFRVDFDFFYWSVELIMGLTFLLLLLTNWVAPRCWSERHPNGKETPRTEFWKRLNYGRATRQRAFRRQSLEVNPIYWLSARVRLKPAHVWAFLGAVGCWWLVGRLGEGRIWLDTSVTVTLALMLNVTLKLWVAIEAGQRLAEDRKTGALEALLTSPVTVKEVLRGHFLALKRQFLLPLLVVAGAGALFAAGAYRRTHDVQSAVIAAVGAGLLLVDTAALAWVSTFLALAAGNAHRAALGAVLRILFLPWMAVGGIVLVANLLGAGLGGGQFWPPGWMHCVVLAAALGLAADFGFGLMAWWRLTYRFRQLAVKQLGLPSKAEARFIRPRPAGTQPAAAILEPTENVAALRSLWAAWRSPRRIAMALVLLAAGASVLVFRSSRSRFPAPVVVRLARSNAPVRISGAYGETMLILPDGSLWQWKNAGRSAESGGVPEELGTNRDWLQAATSADRCTALRKDGSIWTWRRTRAANTPPEQVGLGQHWKAIAACQSDFFAIRQDGTLWHFTEFLIGGSLSLGESEIGTNRDWVAISCSQFGIFGLRRDGTLWVWGRILVARNGTAWVTRNIAAPVQLCRDTNWVSLSGGLRTLVQTRSGELWDVSDANPNPLKPASAICRLVATGFAPGRLGIAFSGGPSLSLFEIRSGGTLCEKPLPFIPLMKAPVGPWRQVGQRSDWVWIWGNGLSAFGLTREGTLWTWGYDPTRSRPPGMLVRLDVLRLKISVWLGGRRASVQAASQHAIQKQPRPLMRLW
jgi:ABC-type Na+ efflux pump permease subunit